MNTEANKRLCHICGTDLQGNVSFCPNCGEKCDAQAVPEVAPEPKYDMSAEPEYSPKSRIDMKRTVLGNAIPVACLIIGVIMIIVGLSVSVPSGYIRSQDVTEYVGGDAYNYIMHASIKGGRIAAAEISKCIYISVGLLIACVSALKLNVIKSVHGKNQ